MRSNELTKKKLNNKGMTLVELIVAIAILAIALVPLMYAFVNVARYSSKGREVQQATSIAHTIMENCKAYPVNEIQTQVSSGEFLKSKYAEGLQVKNGTGGYHVDTADSYKFYIDDVQVDNQYYDVCFELDAYTDVMGNYADAPMMSYENINPTLDAIFMAQSTTSNDLTPSVAAELDEMAYWDAMSQIALNVLTYTQDPVNNLQEVNLSDVEVEASFNSGELNADEFELNRIIEVNMLPAADGESAKVVYKYTYSTGGEYKFMAEPTATATPNPLATPDPLATPEPSTIEVTIPIIDDTLILEKEFDIYKNSTMNDSLANAKINDVYLFYLPGYDTIVDYRIKQDKIILNNGLGTGRTVDIYLFKQRNLGMLEGDVQIAEDNYNPVVTVMPGSGAVNLYHNLANNLITGSDGMTCAIDATITQKTEVEHMNEINTILMYNVLVNVYKPNAYDSGTNQILSTSTPVLTLDGTKVNW